MHKSSILSHRWIGGTAVVAATALSIAIAAPAAAAPLAGVESAAVNAERNYVVDVNFADGIKGKITFLEDGIFRYNIDPTGEFSAYAVPRDESHIARIQAQPDYSKKYSHPQANVSERDGAIVITAGTTTISLDKATAKMTVKSGDNVVMEEAAPVDLADGSTVQTLVKHDGEDFFGGGTQNGRFIHTGNSINIKNESNWVDGGVASPNPFYWSDGGYGVLRNTFADGVYDFGKAEGGQTVATHNENELDAYYFVADAAGGNSTAPIAQELLQAYYKVTGNPILLPEYGFYTGTLNAWNRDMWSRDPKPGYSKKQIKGSAPASDESAGETLYEKGGTGVRMEPGACVETLNGHGPEIHTDNIPEGVTYDREFSAQHHLDTYIQNDIPMGYFLPNDGYGSGYGQNGYGMTGGVDPVTGESSPERLAAVAANVENLREFSEYCAQYGVATGLWSQSYLFPDSNPATEWQVLRDFANEVRTGGVTTLKTDVAWVGHGYSMALDAVRSGYETVTTEVSKRPNIITLDGWAGTQRYGAVWTGDQTGGNWEYIRFHIPTFIGQSLAGNPNVGSDNDGIFGGAPIIATRDYQWKSFAPLMLDMDGWGSYVKAPQTHGDPYTGISRMYLKLKSQLMPYIYTTAASASNIDTGNGDKGLPMVRAILLSEDTAYAQSTKTQYEYTLGEDFLVAPVYQNTADAEGTGDDIRNGIYLPGTEKDIWIDYFTGKQYRGGQVLNNFEAPLWKLPLFVRANAIIPMWEPNNNPEKVDRSVRNIEFFAVDGKNEYNLFEDTGTYCKNTIDTSDKEYGNEGNIDYGPSVKTKITSNADAEKKTATFKVGKSDGSYEGYKKDRTTTFIVNVSAKPESVVAKNGDQTLELTEVRTQEEFDAAKPEAGKAVVFYNEAPNLNYNATAESEQVRAEGFSSQKVTTTPKLYVKFATADVNAVEQTLEVTGFANEGALPGTELDASLKAPANLAAPEDGLTPTSVKLTWGTVEGAEGYDIEIDGMVNSIPSGETGEFTVTDLAYNSEHEFKIRTRGGKGFSEWSAPLKVKTLEDPWRNVPAPVDVAWEGGEQFGKLDNAFDHDDKGSNHFHSTGSAVGVPMTIDYGKVYALDQFVYTPRQDNGGNGNVSKMKIETSVDGAHWQDHGVAEWDNKGEGKMKPKTVKLEGTSARYLRLTVQESAGGFFSATELALYKVDGSEGQETGSLKAPATVGSEDEQHIDNCVGRENRGTGVADWNSHVAQSSADFNLNGAYDVYDMSFTMSKLDGGTKKEGKVGGSIAVVPEKASVKAGETITIAVRGEGAKNVNAMGALVKYPVADFEFVKDSIKVADGAAGMVNKSGNYTFGEELDSVNIALANKGDKELYGGSEDIATFQLTAKRDCEVALDSQAWLIGPKQDFVTAGEGEVGPQMKELGQDAFNISLTNEGYPTDDGTNVEKLVQQNSYDGLFNDKESDREFEFKWFMGADQPFDMKVGLPANLTFELKEPRALANVELFNGAANSNGSINSLEAKITFTDGSTQEFKGGDFDTNQPQYTFEISEANKAKAVAKVEIRPLTSTGVATGIENPENRMLTIGEINFNCIEGEVTPPVDEVKEIGQDGFAITMTNEKLPEDDGANVEKLIQQNGYEGLFDGDEGANGFEFKWDVADNQQDGKLPEYVMLPTTMHFELKQPVVMRDVQIVNRDTYNGTVTSLEAVITYTDGTTTEFKGGEFAEKQAVYTLAAEKGKQVKRIDITPLTSEGTASGYEGDAAKNRMLTLREINFRYAEADQKPEAEVDKSALAAKVAEVKDLANDGYTAESWDAFQKALEAAQAALDNAEATQQDVDGALKALTDAHAGLVKPEAPQVDKSALAAKVEELKGLASDGYTADSWKAFADALAVAQGALDSADATQQQVDDALKALEAAHAGLVKDEGQGGTGGQGQGGTGGQGEGQGGSGSTGSGGAGAQGKPNGKPGTSGDLAQTGDATAIAVGATGVVGAISAAVGALLRRRRRD